MSGMFGWIEYNKKKINDDFPGLSSQQFLTKCMTMWKELDESERAEWKAPPKVKAEVEAEVEEEDEGDYNTQTSPPYYCDGGCGKKVGEGWDHDCERICPDCKEEVICAECGECPGAYKCVECGDSYCADDGVHNGCWRFQRIMWLKDKSEKEITEIDRKYPDGVCKNCI